MKKLILLVLFSFFSQAYLFAEEAKKNDLFIQSVEHEFVVKDYAELNSGESKYLFAILGKSDTKRGSHLAVYRIQGSQIFKVWQGKDAGANPWKIITCDVDNDGTMDVCVGVWKKTKFHPVFANRLFIYNWDGEKLYPKWLGSRLSSPMFDFNVFDVDNDGKNELVSIEMQRDGSKKQAIYSWNGFGFRGDL